MGIILSYTASCGAAVNFRDDGYIDSTEEELDFRREEMTSCAICAKSGGAAVNYPGADDIRYLPPEIPGGPGSGGYGSGRNPGKAPGGAQGIRAKPRNGDRRGI